MLLRGTYTALVTPFLRGKLDLDGLSRNIDDQIEQEIDGILVLGTTGETPTLSSEEKNAIIRLAVKKAKGKIPVMVGTGDYSTSHTLIETQKAKDLGADVALIVTPYYNKPTQMGIYQHFEKICTQVDIPVIVYNIPGRTGQNIETTTLKKIATLPNIIGVKEASGNMAQIIEVLHSLSENKNFSVLSGDDMLALPLIAMGGHGVISVVSNLIPSSMVSMTQAALKNNFSLASQIHYKLFPLFKAAFIETNPIPIKYAMNLCGLAAGSTRLPLCELSKIHKKHLSHLLHEMNLIRESARDYAEV